MRLIILFLCSFLWLSLSGQGVIKVDKKKSSISPSLINVAVRNQTSISDIIPYFALPDTGLALMVGQEVTIYGDVLINVPIGTNLVVNYSCDIGTESGNNYTINPTSGQVGIHRMIMSFFEGSASISKDTVWLTVYREIEAPVDLKVLLIGNSTMVGGIGQLEPQLTTNLDSVNFTFLGTQGTTYKHEAWSGSAWWSFVTGYDIYTIFTKAGKLNLHAYFTDNSIDIPDIVYIRLGINDFFSESRYDNADFTDLEKVTIINYAKAFCDSLLDVDANIKIILGLPTICENTGAGWNTNYDESIFSQDKYIQNMHEYYKAFVDTFAGGNYNSSIDVAYEVINLDRNDGYPKTDGIHTNGLHPDESGYNQIGNSTATYFNKLLFDDLKPTGLTAKWVNDYDSLYWIDNTGGKVAYQVYESKNGGTYTLAGTTAVGATAYQNTTWQNALMSYKVRALAHDWNSEYSNVYTHNTPLVWKTDQSTLTNVVIGNLNITTGGTVNINWGDGTNANYTGTNTNITKTYSSTKNPYYITLSGDINLISYFSHINQVKSYGSLAKWKLPTSLTYFAISDDAFTGNISGWVLPSSLAYLQLSRQMGTAELSGDISGWVIPSTLVNINMTSYNGRNPRLSGDLSSWTLPTNTNQFYASYQQFTGLAHGAYDKIGATVGYVFTYNLSNQAQIDAFLVDMNNYFTTHTPTQNIKVLLNGSPMPAPSATGLAAKSAIEAKFTAAGYTATITVTP